MSDSIQKRAGLPRAVSGKAALEALRAAANGQKVTGTMVQEDLVLCLDGSDSMLDTLSIEERGPSKISTMLDATHGLVRASASSVCKLGLVVYGDDAQVVCPLTNKYNVFDAAVDTVKANGWTNIGLGLLKSAELLGQRTSTRLKRIILLTDGMEACTRPPKAEEAVDRYIIPLKIVVDCVAFGDGADRELLSRIAGKTGGKVYSANEADALKKTFLQLESGVRGLLTAGNP